MLTVKELIALLQKADPDAVVFAEYEGNFGPVDSGDVRVSEVALTDIAIRTEPSYSWLQTSHPYVTEGQRSVKERRQGVLLWAGGSDDEWPEKLEERKQ